MSDLFYRNITSDEQTPTCSRDIPPHLRSNSTQELTSHNINKELADVKGPLEDMLQDIKNK